MLIELAGKRGSNRTAREAVDRRRVRAKTLVPLLHRLAEPFGVAQRKLLDDRSTCIVQLKRFGLAGGQRADFVDPAAHDDVRVFQFAIDVVRDRHLPLQNPSCVAPHWHGCVP